jgi:uncharacterized sulfatase
MHFSPVSTEGEFESPPNILDEEFWKSFNGPHYGFQHVQMLNRHTSEFMSCWEHYGIWLKEKGLKEEDLKRYFDNKFIGRWELPRDLHPSVFVSEKACLFLEEHIQERKEKPFFMWMSFQDPHNPHVVCPPYDTMVNPDDVTYKKYREEEFLNKPGIYGELYEKGSRKLSFSDDFGVPSAGPAPPDKEQVWRRSIAIHHGMVKLMDEEIGKVVNYLKELDLYENTLVIFTTDHGDYLGNHGFRGKGFPAYEEVYNIPFIVKNVNSINHGKRSSALLGTHDIAPSVLDLIGLEVPDLMEGVSQKDVFLGTKEKVRSHVVIENRPVQKGLYQKMIVTGQYKLVYYYKQTYGELYDLSKDPDQYQNLWDIKEFKSVKIKLLQQLYQEYSSGKSAMPKDFTIDELIEKLDEQIDAEGEVQIRTSFS